MRSRQFAETRLRGLGRLRPPRALRRGRWLGAAAGAAAALVAGVAPAAAQVSSREGIALQNQILELRRDMQSRAGGSALPAPVPLGGGGAGGGAGGSEMTAQLLDRVTTLEEEMRRLRGRLDELANSTQQAQESLGKKIDDLTFRSQSGGGGGAGAAPQAPTSSRGRRPPELAMQEGQAALARRDYDAAETAAREALENGRGPRGTDAQLLLAQALAGKRDYQGAAIAYDDAYNRSRTGSRAPEALIGVATSLSGLGEKPAACSTLVKLNREFPSLGGATAEAAAALRTRAGCR